MTDPELVVAGDQILGAHVDDLREKLAAIEHERWARWQRYMHSQCRSQKEVGGTALVIPPDRVQHWERQIATPYAELSEREKDSDRAQVDYYWRLIEALRTERDEARQELLARVDAANDHDCGPGTEIQAAHDASIAAQAQVAALLPVAEAAKTWFDDRKNDNPPDHPSRALLAAVDEWQRTQEADRG